MHAHIYAKKLSMKYVATLTHMESLFHHPLPPSLPFLLSMCIHCYGIYYFISLNALNKCKILQHLVILSRHLLFHVQYVCEKQQFLFLTLNFAQKLFKAIYLMTISSLPKMFTFNIF